MTTFRDDQEAARAHCELPGDELAMNPSPEARALAEITAWYDALSKETCGIDPDDHKRLARNFIAAYDNCATLLALAARLMETQRTPGTKEVCSAAWCSDTRDYWERNGCHHSLCPLRPATPRAGEG